MAVHIVRRCWWLLVSYDHRWIMMSSFCAHKMDVDYPHTPHTHKHSRELPAAWSHSATRPCSAATDRCRPRRESPPAQRPCRGRSAMRSPSTGRDSRAARVNESARACECGAMRSRPRNRVRIRPRPRQTVRGQKQQRTQGNREIMTLIGILRIRMRRKFILKG